MNTNKALAISFALIGVGLMVSALWIPAKAQLAQLLLNSAWQQTIQTGRTVKPWPWADHHPVAKLSVQSLGIEQLVLSGDEGNVLAFGPGENTQAKQHGSSRVISAHRDTHFRFLERVRVGDVIQLDYVNETHQYRVSEVVVLDAKRYQLSLEQHSNQLFLVTCYPFDAINPGGSLRFLVIANQLEVTNHEI
jgi:sortase A